MDERFLQELKDRVDLANLVAEYGELKKSGKNYMGRSPFRNERTPSFSVSPERGLWYDFGASEGGDAIRFIEKIEQLSFPEAVQFLADKAGLEVPKREIEKDKKNKKLLDRNLAIQQATQAFFRGKFADSPAESYWVSRGFSTQLAEQWGIGYGGSGAQELSAYLQKESFALPEIIQAGVVTAQEFGQQRSLDRFNDRLTIPITEPRQGRVIAFGGRDLSGSARAKYLNSPEHPHYQKSKLLFAWHQARAGILKKDRVIVMEGYFDVIAAHAAGATETVGTCGTALTAEHLRGLQRLSKNIVLAFDNDLAGKKATLRALEMILAAGAQPFIIPPLGGKDWAELWQQDPKQLPSHLSAPQPALPWLIERLLSWGKPTDLATQKKVCGVLFPLLTKLTSPLERAHHLQTLSQAFRQPLGVLEQEFSRFTKQSTAPVRRYTPPAPNPQQLTPQEKLAGLLGGFKNHFSAEKWDTFAALITDEAPKAFLDSLGEEASESPSVEAHSWGMFWENAYGEAANATQVNADASALARIIERQRAGKRSWHWK